MDALRVPDGAQDVASLSGGERRRVALCRLLLSKPDVLLLDEPTNHLDAESVAWLERYLKEYPGTVVAITHDRYFLDNVAGWILELDRGAGIPWEGNYSSWLEQKKERLAVEEKQETARQRTLERELEWVRMAPRARHAKSKARIEAYESLLAEGGAESGGRRRDHHPQRPAAGRRGRAGREGGEGLRRPPAHRRPHVQPAPRRHRRRHRRQRRGQDHAVPHDHRAGEAGRGRAQGGRLGEAGLRRSEPRRPRSREERVGGDLRRRRAAHARQPPDGLARLRGLVQLQGRGPAEAGGRSLGRRAQPRAPRQDAQDAAPTCCCSTSPPTTSTSIRCARSRTRCSPSPAAWW